MEFELHESSEKNFMVDASLTSYDATAYICTSLAVYFENIYMCFVFRYDEISHAFSLSVFFFFANP